MGLAIVHLITIFGCSNACFIKDVKFPKKLLHGQISKMNSPWKCGRSWEKPGE